ncbi:MAG TPA: transposase [Verrucomicrobiae bacterium]|nr:transposase [Verrucomicrobiae bacterium]
MANVIYNNLLSPDWSKKIFCTSMEKNYRLFAWVVMPNHVHTLIETLETPLPEILQGWKSFTSKAINRILKRQGEFWQTDYFDRYIRDEEHFGKVLRYIENNPVKAGLVKSPELWSYRSARYRHERSAGGPPACS